MSALRDWFRRRPSSAEHLPPYQPAIADPHLPPDQQHPPVQQEAPWLQWGFPMPTQYAHPPSHAPTPSFDTVMAVALSESASEADQVHLQCFREKWSHLIEGPQTMQAYMWLNNLISGAACVDACLNNMNPPLSGGFSIWGSL